MTSGDHENAPAAAKMLGVMLAEAGEYRMLSGHFAPQRTSGHPDHAPEAAGRLGMLLAAQEESARQRLQWRSRLVGHPDYAPGAAVMLGNLLSQSGHSSTARSMPTSAYSTWITVSYSPQAAYNLGLVHAARGDKPAARAAFGTAVNSRNAEVVAAARRELDAL